LHQVGTSRHFQLQHTYDAVKLRNPKSHGPRKSGIMKLISFYFWFV